MDISLNDVLEKFNRYKETHPNVVNLWVKYIELRKESMLQVIREGKDVLRKLDTISDISLNDIALLYTMQSTLHSNIT
jgi:hypothetical protein